MLPDDELQLPPGYKIPSFHDAMQELKVFQKRIDAMGPIPRGIILHHSVPPNKTYVQWDTNGDMWAWNNPCILDDIKWVKYNTIYGNYDAISSLFGGVPVFIDHPYWPKQT